MRSKVLSIYIIGERAKRARHYQGCTNSSWCGIYIYIYIYIYSPLSSRCQVLQGSITLSLPKRCNFTPRNVHERFQTLLMPVLTIFTDFLSAVVTSEIAQILSLYGGGFLALKWQS